MEKMYRKWTRPENERLKRQVRAFPQNLHKCFLIVAEEIERSPSAVASHWYTVTSKDPEFIGFFTASEHYVSKNRKNGVSMEICSNIWNRFMRIIRNL